jgi:uroporphyrinogen-III synthase
LIRARRLHAVVAGSAEGIGNLVQMVPDPIRELLLAVPMVVTHPRVAAAAHALGFVRVAVAGAGPSGVLAAVQEACAGG